MSRVAAWSSEAVCEVGKGNRCMAFKLNSCPVHLIAKTISFMVRLFIYAHMYTHIYPKIHHK